MFKYSKKMDNIHTYVLYVQQKKKMQLQIRSTFRELKGINLGVN
jgi:hypothetical protein